ncbi:MAG: DUF4153 domain-containing protein [Muribaculaceae bacterium]|nr:DUF4153 domain-containing protein [Muribaculaceae bacterium]
MMKLKSLLLQLLRSPREFPVEAAFGLVFFGIAAWHSEKAVWSENVAAMVSGVNADVLWLFAPLVVLTFWLGKVNRWAYFLSGLLFLPLMTLNLKPFLWTYGFVFTYALAAILLVVGTRRMDNRQFAAHALHVITQLFFGVVITALLAGAVIAIVASFIYIFGINEPKHLYEHIMQFIWFCIAPQVCCTFISQGEDEECEPASVLQLILNFILSPAVIIYTVILYAYFIKIVGEWDLPKGGVAWLVMGFITVALVGRLMQYVLRQHYYDWFYRRFTWIAIPPLILYWVGSIYRISLYSFTESRFYLMVAGVLMTIFVLMLASGRLRRFQLMALIFAGAVVLFTYIPGLSARDIGLHYQTERLHQVIDELQLVDSNTGKLTQNLNLQKIQTDSLLSERYQDACSVIEYVRKEVGEVAFTSQYGQWKYDEYELRYKGGDSAIATVSANYSLTRPVQLGDYTTMLPTEHLHCTYHDGIVTVSNIHQPLLVYPIGRLVSQKPDLINDPDTLLTYRNDSLLLVLDGINLSENMVENVRTYNFRLFRKR